MLWLHVGAFLSILECFSNSRLSALCESVGYKKCSMSEYLYVF